MQKELILWLMEMKVKELSNGITLMHTEYAHTRAVHCGFIVDCGSREERPGQEGLAHFLEHMIFKGTSKRKNYHVLNYLESVGGDLNAYTTKEKTCVYASIASQHFSRATELLSDILFNSIFPEKEIVKEKQVVAEEIDMYNDSPEESIFEDFDEIIFPGHPLGHPILGSRETVRTFSRDDLSGFIRDQYSGGRIVFASSGNISTKKAFSVAEKWLSDLSFGDNKIERVQPVPSTPVHIQKEHDGSQAHVILGGRSFPMRKDNYLPFIILNNYLGGPANNTRLNLRIREKHGLTYSIYSYYQPYTDSGIWGVYFGCEPGNISRVRKLVEKEMKELSSKPLGDMVISQIRKQLKGQMVLAHEKILSRMIVNAKNQLDFDKHYSLDEILRQIDSVSKEQLFETAQIMFNRNTLSSVTYLPAD